jgi:hypothetical protein
MLIYLVMFFRQQLHRSIRSIQKVHRVFRTDIQLDVIREDIQLISCSVEQCGKLLVGRRENRLTHKSIEYWRQSRIYTHEQSCVVGIKSLARKRD